MQEQYKIQLDQYLNSLPPEKRMLEEDRIRLKKKKPTNNNIETKVLEEPEAPTTLVECVLTYFCGI